MVKEMSVWNAKSLTPIIWSFSCSHDYLGINNSLTKTYYIESQKYYELPSCNLYLLLEQGLVPIFFKNSDAEFLVPLHIVIFFTNGMVCWTFRKCQIEIQMACKILKDLKNCQDYWNMALWCCKPKMVLRRTRKKLLVTHLYISRSLELGRRFKL